MNYPNSTIRVNPDAKRLKRSRLKARKRKVATVAEREHLARVKSMGCLWCEELGWKQKTPTECHHVREGTSRKDHLRVVPLCRDHHQELHRSRRLFRDHESHWLKKMSL